MADRAELVKVIEAALLAIDYDDADATYESQAAFIADQVLAAANLLEGERETEDDWEFRPGLSSDLLVASDLLEGRNKEVSRRMYDHANWVAAMDAGVILAREVAYLPSHWRETLAENPQWIVGLTKKPDFDAEDWEKVEVRAALSPTDSGGEDG